jgi:hypothetical protein
VAKVDEAIEWLESDWTVCDEHAHELKEAISILLTDWRRLQSLVKGLAVTVEEHSTYEETLKVISKNVWDVECPIIAKTVLEEIVEKRRQNTKAQA